MGHKAGWLAGVFVVAMAGSAQAEPIFGSNDPAPERDTGNREETEKRKEKAEAFRPGFGARVGGYGFRDPEGGREWDACRMNGFGVFGTLDLNKYFYGELSVDFYNATPEVVEEGLDRNSTHGLIGAGFRMFPDFVLTPYIVLGGGGEYTRVALPQGDIDAVYPMGYIGLGAELNITRELKIGATVRMLATTRPTYASTNGSGSIYGSSASSSLTGEQNGRAEMQFDVASQGQFHLRYAL